MRCRVIVAGNLLAALASMPTEANRPTGKAAHDLPMEVLLRMDARMNRYRLNHRRALSPLELVDYAAKRRRAAQGKPGKRGKR